jgi:hypothetical protein
MFLPPKRHPSNIGAIDMLDDANDLVIIGQIFCQ